MSKAIVFVVAAAAVCATAWPGAAALAQGTMYACESGRQFYTINLATGAKTLLGSIGANVSISASLTYDCQAQTTFVSNTGGFAGQSRTIYTLNVSTRQATLIGPYGDPAILMHAIEVDSHTGAMYGVSNHNHGLYSINRTTGAATLIGLTGLSTTGLTTFDSMGFDSHNGIMYLINTGTRRLYRVNLTTAAITLVGPLNGPINIGGMAYNPDNRTMYLVDNDGDMLYAVNLTTGAATPIGPTGVGNLIGLAYVTPTCPPPPPPRCIADVDDGSGTGMPDGGVTIEDLLYYLTIFESGLLSADVDNGSFTGTPDGGVTIDDLLYYLFRFEGGC